MNLFRTKRISWWEIGLIKLAVACIAVAIGANWPALFVPYTVALLIVGVLIGLFALFVWLRN